MRASSVLLVVLVHCMRTFWAFRIGAFNLEIFGKTKSSNEDVMGVLAQILSRYDIVLIQEVRNKTGEAVDLLLEKVNSVSRGQYKYVISERTGRSNIKEQYGFFYRDDGNIKVKGHKTFDEKDSDPFEREPYMVHFEVTSTVIQDCVLVGIHTKPVDAVNELKHLPDVFDRAEKIYQTPNVAILGDYNADCTYVRPDDWDALPVRTDKAYHWLIDDEADTTVSGTDCAYDRIVVKGDEFFNGVVPDSAKVFYFDKDESIQLGEVEVGEVSDHYPIEFELKEHKIEFEINELQSDERDEL